MTSLQECKINHIKINYDNDFDNKSTSSTESEEETKLVATINDMKGYVYNKSKNDEQEEQIESKYNDQIEMESYQDDDKLSFSGLENLLDNHKNVHQNMDENIQEDNKDITEQSNKDKDNDNIYNKDEENESVNELMKRDELIKGHTSKGKIIKIHQDTCISMLNIAKIHKNKTPNKHN